MSRVPVSFVRQGWNKFEMLTPELAKVRDALMARPMSATVRSTRNARVEYAQYRQSTKP